MHVRKGGLRKGLWWVLKQFKMYESFYNLQIRAPPRGVLHDMSWRQCLAYSEVHPYNPRTRHHILKLRKSRQKWTASSALGTTMMRLFHLMWDLIITPIYSISLINPTACFFLYLSNRHCWLCTTVSGGI